MYFALVGIMVAAALDIRTVLTDPGASHADQVRALSAAEKDPRKDVWRWVAALIPRSDETLRPHLIKALRRTNATQHALKTVQQDPAASDETLWLDALRVLRVTKPTKGSADAGLRHRAVAVRQEAALLGVVAKPLINDTSLLTALNDDDSTVRDFVVQALRVRLSPATREALRARAKIETNAVVQNDIAAALALP